MIVEAIKQSLAEVRGQPSLAETLSESSRIIEDLGLDSLEMLNFMLKLEERIGVKIEFERLEFADLSSVASLGAALEKMR